MDDLNPHRYLRRAALVEWMSRPAYTHAITLMPNRADISADMLRRMFGRFCREVDQYMIGVRNVQARYSYERLDMIAMPEKLNLNPHLHGVANFSPCFWQNRLDKPWQLEVHRVWKRCTRGAGELKLDPLNGRGFQFYSTKELLRADHGFFRSWDFHRDDKLVDHNLRATLASIGPSSNRKTASGS